MLANSPSSASSFLFELQRCASLFVATAVCLILVSHRSADGVATTNESVALLSFLSATGGAVGWNAACRAGWGTFAASMKPCVLNQTDGNNSYVPQLYGVGCTTNLSSAIDQTVVLLALGSCSLTANDFGALAAVALTNLTALVHLDLSDNRLGGSLFHPRVSWTSLTDLELLNVSANALTGTLPSENIHDATTWRWPPRLKYFNATSNDLYGALPELPRLATTLALVHLQNNRLNGTFPATWDTNFSSLEVLAIGNNSIEGAVPQGVGWSRMHTLFIGSNQFSGTLPTRAWVVHMPSLTKVDVSHNGLLGNDTHFFGQLSGLVELNLRANLFSGTLPNEFCNCSGLVVATMDLNLFSGTLPACFVGLNRTLTTLWMAGKEEEAFNTMNPAVSIADRTASLSGTIPAAYGQLSRMESFVIGNAPHINGTLPAALCGFGNITRFYVYNTSVHGTIPSCYGMTFLALTNFRCQRNQLNGTLPNATIEMPAIRTTMRNLWLDNNHFTGTIPSDWGPMTSMLTLTLDNNSLTGTVPDKEWAAANTTFAFLQGITLSNNSLSGTLPFFSEYILQQQGVFAFYFMAGFSGTRNLFTGPMPDWNATRWTPMLVFFDVSHNRLNGTFPELLAFHAPRLAALNLSHNALSYGGLPDMRSDVVNTALKVLILDRIFDPARTAVATTTAVNHTVPLSWSLQFRGLVVLSLSQNQLHGSLSPSLLTNWANSLVSLNIGQNALQGPLPALSPTRLVFLDVADNRFSGALPSLLPPIAMAVSLANNRFVGTIPSTWASSTGYLQRLIGVNVSGNHLRGPLPSVWSLTWQRMVALRNCICGPDGVVPAAWVAQSPTTAVAFSPRFVCVPSQCVVTASYSVGPPTGTGTATTSLSAPSTSLPPSCTDSGQGTASHSAMGTPTDRTVSPSQSEGHQTSSSSPTLTPQPPASPTRRTATSSSSLSLSRSTSRPPSASWTTASSSSSSSSSSLVSATPPSSSLSLSPSTSRPPSASVSHRRSSGSTLDASASRSGTASTSPAASSSSSATTTAATTEQGTPSASSTAVATTLSASMRASTSVPANATSTMSNSKTPSGSSTSTASTSRSVSMSSSHSNSSSVTPTAALAVEGISAAALLVRIGDAAATAVVAPLAAATLAGSASIVQQSILALKLRQCAFEGPLDALRVSDSPTQWMLGPPAAEAAARGAVVGNALLILAVGGLCLVVGTALHCVVRIRQRKGHHHAATTSTTGHCEEQKGAERSLPASGASSRWVGIAHAAVTTAGLPGRLNFGLSFLYQPMVAASVVLVSSSDNNGVGDVAIGLVTLAGLLTVTLYFLFRAYQTSSRCMCWPRDTADDSLVVRCFGPKFKWVTLHDAAGGSGGIVGGATSRQGMHSSDDTALQQLHAYEFLFSKYASHACWFFAAQHATSFGLGILAGLRPDERSMCDRCVIGLFVIVGGSLLLLVCTRPYHTMRDNIFSALLQSLGLLNAALLMASSDYGDAADAVVLLQLALLVVYSAGKASAQVSMRLQQLRKSRRRAAPVVNGVVLSDASDNEDGSLHPGAEEGRSASIAAVPITQGHDDRTTTMMLAATEQAWDDCTDSASNNGLPEQPPRVDGAQEERTHRAMLRQHIIRAIVTHPDGVKPAFARQQQHREQSIGSDAAAAVRRAFDEDVSKMLDAPLLTNGPNATVAYGVAGVKAQRKRLAVLVARVCGAMTHRNDFDDAMPLVEGGIDD